MAEKRFSKWRYGFNRWVILLLVILNIFFVYYVYNFLLPNITECKCNKIYLLGCFAICSHALAYEWNASWIHGKARPLFPQPQPIGIFLAVNIRNNTRIELQYRDVVPGPKNI